MSKIKLHMTLEIEEEELAKVFQYAIQFGAVTTSVIPQPVSVENEKIFTSIRQIADHFRCSQPTAQKIKNAIPKDMYSQIDRTFTIPESVLVNHSNNRPNK